MPRCSVAAGTLMLGLAIVLLQTAGAFAAEIQALAGGGMTGPLRELAALFESTSGHKVVFRFGTTPELIKLAAGGTAFDVGVVPTEVMRDDGARAKFTPGATTDIARVGLGVAVKSGAPKPDISTPEAFKQTLLKAQSIATIPASAAGAQVLKAFDMLGVGEDVKSKIKAQGAPGQIVEAVAKEEAELGVFLINTLTAPGVDVVGPFPAQVQQEVRFTSAVAGEAKAPEAAHAFIRFLTTPAAAALIKAKGMTPG